MKPIALVFALTAGLALAASAHGQMGQCAAAAGLTSNTFVCVTPKGSSSCNVNMPYGPGYTIFVSGSEVCCGSTVTSFFYGPPNLCWESASMFRDPGLLRAAVDAQLETGEQFLTADCQGNLVPFESSPQPSFAAEVAPITLN
jgi:hypothetical protein